MASDNGSTTMIRCVKAEKIEKVIRKKPCKFCNKEISIKSFKRHERGHTEEKPFTCDYCPKSFTQNTYLKHHKTIHTGEKPYKCDQCTKCFRSYSGFCYHKKRHTGELLDRTEKDNADKTQKAIMKKPCRYCNKELSAKDLPRHERLHTGEKPFTCKYCLKSFADSRYLKVHQVVHTGEKSFKCDQCKSCFKSSSNLCRHKQRYCHINMSFGCRFCEKYFCSSRSRSVHERSHKGDYGNSVVLISSGIKTECISEEIGFEYTDESPCDTLSEIVTCIKREEEISDSEHEIDSGHVKHPLSSSLDQPFELVSLPIKVESFADD